MSKINGRPVRRTAVGVLASTLMLSGVVTAASPASAATGFSLERIAGANRYETSAAIATAFGPTNSAILASGEAGRTVDALSANFLAGVQQAPVLLTTRTRIPASVRSVLNRLGGAKNVTIVGGTAAVGQMVEDELRQAGFTITRLGGADRYATSEEVITAGRASANPIALVASGTSFPDALAGGPLAYKGKHPVILTSGGTLPQDSIDALVAAGTTRVIILGGLVAVPASVEAQLAARNITVVTRLGGADRSETSRLIADYLIDSQGFTNTTFNVASGDPRGAGADALSGAALSGKQNRALLITNTPNSGAPVIAFARARANTLNATGNIFGGPVAVSIALEAAIEAAGSANGGPVALTAATVAQGGNLTGTITGDFSSVTVSGCGFTNQTIGADDNTTTAGRQFTLNVGSGQATGNCTLTFTATPTGGGAAVTQTIQVNVTGRQAGATATARPELTSAQIVSTTSASMATTTNAAGTVVRYTFDERVASVGAAGLFKIYNFSDPNTPILANSATLDTADATGRTVLARFNTLVSTAVNADNTTADISVATVEANAVTDAQGLLSPTGDAPLGSGQQGNATLTAGRTTAPDLVSLGGFRGTADANVTAVDFIFDQAAFVQNTGGFQLVLTDGRIVQGTGPAVGTTNTTNPGGGSTAGGNGTTIITVLFTDPPAVAAVAGTPATSTTPATSGTPAQPAVELSTTTGQAPITVARGTVFSGSVGSLATGTAATGTGTAGTANAGTGAPTAGGQQVNPLESSDTPKNNTTGPDLVSVTFTRGAANTTTQDVALFTFDQPVSSTTGTGTLFRVYTNTGQELVGGTGASGGPAAPAVGPGASNNQVAVSFANGALVNAVGGNVLAGAATGTAAGSGANLQDEVAAANVQQPGTTAQPAGRTTGPDLLSVTLAGTGTFNQFAATYTFDEQVTPAAAAAAAGAFNLYLADGTRLACAAGAGTVGTTTTTNNQVTCTSFTVGVDTGAVAATNAQVGAATAGTAIRTAVVDVTGNNNVEGYEVTTGGTGTATQ